MNKQIIPRISLLDPDLKHTSAADTDLSKKWQAFFDFDGRPIYPSADTYQQEQIDEHASMAIRERK